MGQTAASSGPGIQPSYFQQPAGASHDPFLKIGNELPPPPHSTSTPAVFTPPTMPGPAPIGADVSSPPSIPAQSSLNSPHAMPPRGSSPSGIYFLLINQLPILMSISMNIQITIAMKSSRPNLSC